MAESSVILASYRDPAEIWFCFLLHWAAFAAYYAAMDAIDLRILGRLQQDARISNVELARAVNLSASPCLARVRALEAGGYISR